MFMSYDPEADAAYISLVDSIKPGESETQTDLIDLPGQAQAIFDFDREGRLLGIEILSAGQIMRPTSLEQSVPPAEIK